MDCMCRHLKHRIGFITAYKACILHGVISQRRNPMAKTRYRNITFFENPVFSHRERSHLDQPKKVKTGLMDCDIDRLKPLKGDMEMGNQTYSSRFKQQVRGQGSRCSHVIKALQWWLIRASLKFPKRSVLLWDGVHAFHQMEIPSASKDISALLTYTQAASHFEGCVLQKLRLSAPYVVLFIITHNQFQFYFEM